MCLVVGDSLLVVDAAVQGDVDAEGQESHVDGSYAIHSWLVQPLVEQANSGAVEEQSLMESRSIVGPNFECNQMHRKSGCFCVLGIFRHLVFLVCQIGSRTEVEPLRPDRR